AWGPSLANQCCPTSGSATRGAPSLPSVSLTSMNWRPCTANASLDTLLPSTYALSCNVGSPSKLIISPLGDNGCTSTGPISASSRQGVRTYRGSTSSGSSCRYSQGSNCPRRTPSNSR